MAASSRASRPASGPTPWTIRSTGSTRPHGPQIEAGPTACADRHRQDRRAAAFRMAASSRASRPASGPTPWTIRSTGSTRPHGPQIEAGPTACADRHRQDRRAAAFRMAASSRASRPASGPTPWTIRSTGSTRPHGPQTEAGPTACADRHRQDRRAAAFRMAASSRASRPASGPTPWTIRSTGSTRPHGPQIEAGPTACADRHRQDRQRIEDRATGSRPGRREAQHRQDRRAAAFRVAASSWLSVPFGHTARTIRSTGSTRPHGPQIEAGPQVAPAGGPAAGRGRPLINTKRSRRAADPFRQRERHSRN